MKHYSNKKNTEKDEEVHEPLLSSSNNTKDHKLFETYCDKRYLIVCPYQVGRKDIRVEKFMEEERFL